MQNTPEFIIKGGIEAADFNARKFMLEKNQVHNEWYKSVGKAFRILETYAKTQYPQGLNYNSHGTASWGDLISGNAPPQTGQQAPQRMNFSIFRTSTRKSTSSKTPSSKTSKKIAPRHQLDDRQHKKRKNNF